MQDLPGIIIVTNLCTKAVIKIVFGHVDVCVDPTDNTVNIELDIKDSRVTMTGKYIKRTKQSRLSYLNCSTDMSILIKYNVSYIEVSELNMYENESYALLSSEFKNDLRKPVTDIIVIPGVTNYSEWYIEDVGTYVL